ncbi:putative ATP-dependent helicase IRC3 [Coemansia guatemalensis]|uniref:ATP-dependent helicase IRC3 n=1 Tax=Coemansia guatemalensis TaxID=2761395 RepID=A0A9W8I8F7_9FUNG|nr:putative ATP-dependent helicase IRC3 [Coemansia guatemalensis]
MLRTAVFRQRRAQSRRWIHKLRPYQQECIDKCLAALKAGVWRQAVSLPVGSGKTVVFSSLIQQIPPPSPLATKTLVLAHREELLVQAARQIMRASPGLEVQIDQGTRLANLAADVVVASVPTLGRKDSDRLLRYDPQRYKCIVIDEAHHAAAETYARIIDHFQQQKHGSSNAQGPRRLFVWGCSATLRRHDGLELTGVFDEIVYQKHFLEMIREQWLTGLRIFTVRTSSDIGSVRSYAGEYSTRALSNAVNNSARNKAVVKAYQTLATGRRSVLVFAVDVAHAQELCRVFVRSGIRAEAVLGITAAGTREQILQEFRSGELPVVVNCGILTEGTDIPNIDCVIMARPTRSPVLFQQMLGRGMRLAPGKKDCLVIDFVDSFKKDMSQITVPTLLGLDPQLVLKNTDVLDTKRLAELQKQHTPPSPEDIDSKIEKDLATVSRFIEDEEGGGRFSEERPSGQLDSLKALGFKAHLHLNPLKFFELKQCPPGMSAKEYCEGLDHVSSGTIGSWQLRQISKLSWLCLAPDRYMINVNTSYYFVTRTAKDGLWRGSRRVYMQKSSAFGFYTAEAAIGLTAETLERAICGVDSLIRAKTARTALLQLRWDAPWRMQPPTTRQLSMLKKLGVRIPESIEGVADASSQSPASHIHGITRGSATNLITRIRHGSSKAWRELDKAKGRLETARTKDQQAAASKALWAKA